MGKVGEHGVNLRGSEVVKELYAASLTVMSRAQKGRPSWIIFNVGGRFLGSAHLEIATVSAVLLLVPGVAVLNTQTDVIEGKPNIAAARGLGVIYILLFMTLGLLAAQRLILQGI